jgi:formylglycine-generating enzyme required for sulfatase activity
MPAGAGRTDCGPNKESCCTSLPVTGGTYFRTYANDGTGPTDEDDAATISDVRLDEYLVTVGRFRQFVAAWNGGAGYTPPAGSGKHTHLGGGNGLVDLSSGSAVYEPGWNPADDVNVAPTEANLACDPTFATWTSTPGSQETLPINCVTWHEAYAFCLWDGGFLPSEAEFEYTSAGGSQQREYPWGLTDPGTASQYAIYGCEHGGDGTGCTGLGNLAPVGSAPLGAGRWGQLDLAGDVSEWNLDHYAAFGNPCTDCTALAGGSGRVNRGGSYRSSASPYLQAFFRGDLLYATDRTSSFGIRCARKP